MSKAPDLREIPELPDEIIQAGLNGELVLFVGSGVSMLLGLPSWGGLAQQVLQALRQNGLLNFSEIEQLKILEPKKQLSIAKLIAGDDLDLTEYFKGKTKDNSIYKSINDIGCACVTTNYDELLAPRFQEVNDDPIQSMSVKPKEVVRIYNKSDFFAKHLDEPGSTHKSNSPFLPFGK